MDSKKKTQGDRRNAGQHRAYGFIRSIEFFDNQAVKFIEMVSEGKSAIEMPDGKVTIISPGLSKFIKTRLQERRKQRDGLKDGPPTRAEKKRLRQQYVLKLMRWAGTCENGKWRWIDDRRRDVITQTVELYNRSPETVAHDIKWAKKEISKE